MWGASDQEQTSQLAQMGLATQCYDFYSSLHLLCLLQPHVHVNVNVQNTNHNNNQVNPHINVGWAR